MCSSLFNSWFDLRYLNLLTRWWIKMSVCSLATSFPGHVWSPLPNGMYVLGFIPSFMQSNGSSWISFSLIHSNRKLWKRTEEIKLGIKFQLGYISQVFHTSNLDGLNLCGSTKKSGLWWMLRNKGSTFHPFGIKYPVVHGKLN